MTRMDHPRRIYRATGRDQRLSGYLSAEHSLAPLLRAAPPEEIHLERLQIEQFDEIVECGLTCLAVRSVVEERVLGRDAPDPLASAALRFGIGSS